MMKYECVTIHYASGRICTLHIGSTFIGLEELLPPRKKSEKISPDMRRCFKPSIMRVTTIILLRLRSLLLVR